MADNTPNRLKAQPAPPPDARADTRVDTRAPAEPSLGDLFRELTQETTTLVRQEVSLAKTELRESARTVARRTAMLMVGGMLALVGFLVLTAFLVILLGSLLLNYWLAALIVGAVYLLIGGGVAWSQAKQLGDEDLAPDQTIQTLKEDKQWAQNEAQQVKRDLR